MCENVCDMTFSEQSESVWALIQKHKNSETCAAAPFQF